MVMKHVGKWWDHEWQKQRECALMKAKHGNQIFFKKELNRTILGTYCTWFCLKHLGFTLPPSYCDFCQASGKWCFTPLFFPPPQVFKRWDTQILPYLREGFVLSQHLQFGALPGAGARKPHQLSRTECRLWLGDLGIVGNQNTGTKRRSFQTDQILSASTESTDIYQWFLMSRMLSKHSIILIQEMLRFSWGVDTMRGVSRLRKAKAHGEGGWTGPFMAYPPSKFTQTLVDRGWKMSFH